MSLPQTTRVLLLRHAETAAPDYFHGSESDIELGARGKVQAEEVAKLISDENPDRLYTSAMRRAIETAAAIAAHTGLEPIVIPEFHERKMGPLSGQPYSETMHHYEAARAKWMEGDLDATHEGGESYAQVRDRVFPKLTEVFDGGVGETLVVVIHGMVMRVIFSELLEGHSRADFADFKTENAVVHDLTWNKITRRLSKNQENV